MNNLVNSLFIGVVIFLVGFLHICLKRSTKKQPLIMGGIIGWLILIGLLTINGFFMNFNTIPPRIIFAVFPMIVLLIYVARSAKVIPLVASIPHTWLINVQAFRFVIEVIFWLLARQHIIPEIMTFNGRNIDILTGITAPVIAYFCFTSKKWNKKTALIWNGLGMVLLVNVFTHGLLAAPTPFQVFFTAPPNTFVGSFPYSWLPAFVVPCAFLFHILSIRKILNKEQSS